MKNVLVTFKATDEEKGRMESIEGFSFKFREAQDLTSDELREAEIIAGNIPADRAVECEKLEWIQLNMAGAADFTAPGVLPENVIITNATGAYGLALSEHMLAMLLSLQKKLYLYEKDQIKHEWTDEGNVTSIWGSHTLVVGLGDIGSEFAKKMKALGSTVRGIRRHLTAKPDYLDGIYTMESLDELLHWADIVAITLPGTPETEHLFDIERFRKMKSTAIFLNVGRGSVAVTSDLCKALNEGIIGGAGIDVVEPEPLPKDDPLWDAKNIIITPHISGYYHLEETRRRIADIIISNLEAYAEGKPLKNIVDRQTGYRKFDEKEAVKASRGRKLILASASPRRKELLTKADIPFTVVTSDKDEEYTATETPAIVMEIARGKAKDVLEKVISGDPDDNFVVLAADTVVSVDGKILGKPEDEDDAFNCIKNLQGRSHEVYTGVVIATKDMDKEPVFKAFYEKTIVEFYPVSDADIRAYIATGEPMDKAGSYAIQGGFAKYIKSIRGDYSNVVGLPIGRVCRELSGVLRKSE
ncbi:MAF protein [Lachnospiraceae bacterium]|nr:MAF protein [Lachnospiraceae bacterium]